MVAMALKERQDADLKAAMKSRDALRVNVLRMLKSAIKYREIEVMKSLDDAGVQSVIVSEIKRRREAAEQYQVVGNRQDLADKEVAEIAVLQSYLPQPR